MYLYTVICVGEQGYHHVDEQNNNHDQEQAIQQI